MEHFHVHDQSFLSPKFIDPFLDRQKQIARYLYDRFVGDTSTMNSELLAILLTEQTLMVAHIRMYINRYKDLVPALASSSNLCRSLTRLQKQIRTDLANMIVLAEDSPLTEQSLSLNSVLTHSQYMLSQLQCQFQEFQANQNEVDAAIFYFTVKQKMFGIFKLADILNNFELATYSWCPDTHHHVNLTINLSRQMLDLTVQSVHKLRDQLQCPQS